MLLILIGLEPHAVAIKSRFIAKIARDVLVDEADSDGYFEYLETSDFYGIHTGYSSISMAGKWLRMSSELKRGSKKSWDA